MSDRSNARDLDSKSAAAPRERSAATVAAVITSPGRGALATVQVRGPDTLRAVAALCRSEPEAVLQMSRDGRLWMTRWCEPGGEPVVIHVLSSEQVEINCHGGPMPVQAILQGLKSQGVCLLSWNDLARRIARTRIEAEAAKALAQAPTLRTAAILLDQYDGALSNCFGQLREWLEQGRAADVHHGLCQLLVRTDLGLHLVVPWRIAIVGRPNVGKSSLLNALVGFDRAIVHPTAGTTRDLVTVTTAIDGWPVELCDSAGIRAANEPLESAGIERARQAIVQSDFQIVVFDRNQPLSDEDQSILSLCPRPTLVANKSDLLAAWDLSELEKGTGPICAKHPSGRSGKLDLSPFPAPFPVSATTRVGLNDLLAHFGRALVHNPPGEAEAIPFTDRQIRGLQLAEQSIRLGDFLRTDEVLVELLGSSK